MQKKTLRKLPPITKKAAMLSNELSLLDNRLKKLLPEIHRLERDSQALAARREWEKGQDKLRREGELTDADFS